MRQMNCAQTVAALMLLSSGVFAQSWDKGPVIIGGDDADDAEFHYPGSGEYFFREAFSFFGRHVSNGKQEVVGIGVNGLDTEYAFNEGSASDLL